LKDWQTMLIASSLYLIVAVSVKKRQKYFHIKKNDKNIFILGIVDFYIQIIAGILTQFRRIKRPTLHNEDV